MENRAHGHMPLNTGNPCGGGAFVRKGTIAATMEIKMAEGNGGGGMGLLGVIVGAALVIGLLFFFMGGIPGNAGSNAKNIDITIKAPAAPKQ